MAGLFNLFSSTRQQVTNNPAPQQGQVHNQNTVHMPQKPADPNVPTIPGQQQANTQQGTTGTMNTAPGSVTGQGDQNNATPLDNLKGIWDNTNSQTANEGQYRFPNIDPAKLAEGVGKLDFTRNLNPESVTKALGGDMVSFKEVMNQVAREAFSTSFQASGKFANQAFDGYDASISKRIPKEFRGLQDGMAVRGNQNLKALQHPTVAPVVEMLQDRIRQSFPDATPDQIAEYTQQWFSETSKLFSTSQSESDNSRNQSSQGKRGAVTDFSDF